MEDNPASSKEGPTKTAKQIRRRKYYLEVQVPKRIKIRASVKYEESLRKKDPFRAQSALETFVKSLGKKNIKSWEPHLKENLQVICLQQYATIPSAGGPPVVTGAELIKRRSYLISFFRKDKRLRDGGELIDLYEVRRSELKGANMGLFSKTKFQAGDVMGVFFGKIKSWGTNDVTCYAMSSERHQVLLDPGGGVDSGGPFHFGLHFANDPSIGTNSVKMVTRQDAHRYSHNFFVDDNMIARASCDIECGQELFLNYNWDEGDSECTCPGCLYLNNKFK
jgi:hypothetical protein